MKKILCIIESLGSGGAERQLVGLSVFLKEKGFDIKLVTYINIPFFKHILETNNIQYENIDSNKYNRLLKIKNLVHRYRPDVIIAYLEGALQRSNMMMQDLQDEFDEQLLETKIQEMTAFFAKLNADKYGRILDTLLQVRKGIIQLKKQHIVLPPEISGLFILIQKLSQFVIDNHIDPIMKPNSKQRIKANEAELCDYEGTPFKDNNEEKIIMVFSPGWIYKDKDIRIARPKIKEVVENE